MDCFDVNVQVNSINIIKFVFSSHDSKLKGNYFQTMFRVNYAFVLNEKDCVDHI